MQPQQLNLKRFKREISLSIEKTSMSVNLSTQVKIANLCEPSVGLKLRPSMY